MSARGVEARVPFWIKDSSTMAMRINPQDGNDAVTADGENLHCCASASSLAGKRRVASEESNSLTRRRLQLD